MKFYSLLILVLMLSFGCRPQRNSNVDLIPTKIPVQTASNSSESVKIEPVIDFYNLIGKSPEQIEKIYGKPDLIDTKSISKYNGEYRIYNDKSGKRLLQVDYLNKIAVALYLEIPEKAQLKDPDSTLKLCGLKALMSDAISEQKGFWWNQSAKPFKTARIARYNDSGLYYSCEVHSV